MIHIGLFASISHADNTITVLDRPPDTSHYRHLLLHSKPPPFFVMLRSAGKETAESSSKLTMSRLISLTLISLSSFMEIMCTKMSCNVHAVLLFRVGAGTGATQCADSREFFSFCRR